MKTKKAGKNVPGHPMEELIRTERLPHIWCAGCGIGTVFGSVMAAIQKSGYDLDKTAIVSGIGCTARMAGYIRLDSFHTTHGRALPFATGLKLANPELKVLVVSGDGDLLAIGGNHFIHAARRNIDITVICVNNLNYGMTGGQARSEYAFWGQNHHQCHGLSGGTVQFLLSGLCMRRSLRRTLDIFAYPQTHELHNRSNAEARVRICRDTDALPHFLRAP